MRPPSSSKILEMRTQALQWFTGVMLLRLTAKGHRDRSHDQDGQTQADQPGWLNDECTFDHLLNRMAEHCGQINGLVRVFVNGNNKEKTLVAADDVEELVKQCSDCANFAMMIADRAKHRSHKLIPPLGGFFVE